MSIVIIQIVVVIYSFSFISFDSEYFRKLSILTLLCQLTGIVLLISMCKLQFIFNRFSVAFGVILLTLFIVIITSVLSQVVGYLDMQLTFNMFNNYGAVNFLNIKLSISTVLIFLALVRYFYIQDQWEQQTQKHADARLNALQARIKPHFLFNSLNSITSLISIDTQKAEKAITDFASLMRRAFTHKEKEISIEEEIKWVKQYLAIEKIRMGERLDYSINCESNLLNHKIPVLCLQPLVENAIIHGVSTLENGGLIEINISTFKHNMEIQVVNPFIKESNSESNGMALKNIKERLHLQYNDKASVKISTTNDTYTINMSLPL